jgi:hypothetical protein
MPVSRKELARLDLEGLLLDEKFLRFLSTIRLIAGIETTAYGPEDRHLHFVEGRRSLWCDILRMAEIPQPEALLLILQAELKASKETTSGRRKYNRLDTDTDGSEPDASGGLDFLDYGTDASS